MQKVFLSDGTTPGTYQLLRLLVYLLPEISDTRHVKTAYIFERGLKDLIPRAGDPYKDWCAACHNVSED